MPRAGEDLFNEPKNIIGKSFTIEASYISGADSLLVDGTVIGTIDLNATLHLSESGFVEGDIYAVSACIAGQVDGNIHCESMLRLESTALVNGDIVTSSVVVEEGAVLRGRCKTGTIVRTRPE